MRNQQSDPWGKSKMNFLKGFSFACMFGLLGSGALAQSPSKYHPGASDTEIKIGQTYPYSGPLSSVAEIGITQSAYITMINDRGGINGRKVTFISLDDNYSPAKSIEQVRKLVEQDEVLAIFNPFGTPTATATQKYLNSKKVPQLFAGTGSARFNDPAFPWSSSIVPGFVTEGAILGKYVAERIKTAKVAILYQNDDYGKDYAKGFKDAVASSPGIQIVKEAAYEVAEPTIDSQITQLAASEADILLNASSGRATVQSIRTISNLKWKPLQLLYGRWADVDAVFKPVGMDKAVGIISTQYLRSLYDPTGDADPAVIEYKEFMKKYRPGANEASALNVQGFLYGQLLSHILREAGNNLTRDNINSIALNLRNLELGLLLPGVKINTSPTQKHLIVDQILTRFDGVRFMPIE
jgi:branched-chain amino acid transport system substrate-binding protein